MNIKSKKFIITFSIVFLVLGICFKDNLFLNIASGSNLDGSSGSAENNTFIANNVVSDTMFISALTSLEKIKIDKEFFESNIFKSLVDNSVNINSSIPGRDNPFAPIGSEKLKVTNTTTPKISTVEPTEITSNSAKLNGLINDNSITSGYFKYAKDESLSLSTVSIKQTMMGNFEYELINLIPNTRYYYKACIKLNGVENCGGLISFITN